MLTYAALALIVFVFTINVDLPFIMTKRKMLGEEKQTWSIIFFSYQGSCSPSPIPPGKFSCLRPVESQRLQIQDFEII